MVGETVFQLAESSPKIVLQLCCANLSDLTRGRLLLYLDGAVCMRTETALSLLETDLQLVVSVNTNITSTTATDNS